MLNSVAIETTVEENRFLELYQLVLERDSYLNNEARIVQYSSILRYFMKFLQQSEVYSPRVVSVLFQANMKLGEIYFEEALKSQLHNEFFLAAEYYNQALSFVQNVEEKNSVLLALKDVYYYIKDEDAYVKVEETWAENHQKDRRFAAYVLLAQHAEIPQLKARFLEKALAELMEQEDGFYAKYQNTLDVCSQLTAIYELLGEKEKALRIRKLREHTLQLLN